MRLLRLGLRAFGPFVDVELDFERGAAGAFHAVFGANEAGKSTSLRAISALLYGIPERTADAHTHAGKDLLLAGELQRASGERFAFLRRKGRKNTLLSLSGEPLPDASLAPFLCGVSLPVFQTVFGLDCNTLRAGGEELLRGGGQLGQSLFGAGVGLSGVRQVLEEFEREANEAFTPQGRKKRLNLAIDAVAEARREVSQHSTSAGAYQQQQERMRELEAERETYQAARATASAELKRLARVLGVRPLLAKRSRLQEELQALGEVTRLAEGAAAERLQSSSELQRAEAELERLERERARRQVQLAELALPMELLLVPEERLVDLRNRLGVHRKARADLPKVQGELRALTDDVREHLRRGQSELDLDRVDELRVSAAQSARLRELAGERLQTQAELKHLERELEEAASSSRRARDELAALEGVADLTRLERALAPARSVVEALERVEQSERGCELQAEELERAAQALELWQSDVFELVKRAWPSVETLSEYERLWERASGRRERAGERCSELQAGLSQVERQLDELRRQGPIPSERELSEARRERGARWTEFLASAFDARAQVRYERAVERADDVADRLRHAAERVAHHAALDSERELAKRRCAQADAERATANEDWTRLQGDYERLWADLPSAPHPPRAMLAWVRRVQELGRGVAAYRETLAGAVVERNRAEQILRELRAALGDAGGLSAELAAPVALVATGAAALAAAQARLRERGAAERAHRAATERQELLERQRGRLEAVASEWQAAWDVALQAAALPAGTGPGQALASLEERGELFRQLERARDKERRIAGMQRDAEGFARDVAQLAEATGIDEPEWDCERLAEAIVARVQQAHREQDTRRRLLGELEERERAREEALAQAAQAQQRLARLSAAARVADPAELPEAERRSELASSLERELRELESAVLEQGEGSDLESLAAEARAIEPDRARARQAELEAELSECDERFQSVSERLASVKQGLALLGQGAAEAAERLEECVAAAAAEARRYVRRRLAASILRDGIERYRERHQEPLLQRANQLFPRLTLERYAGLKVGIDARDERVLLAVRRDGKEVDVAGLSDGTRDQLFLALRVASIERYADFNEAMPLVLDDALVHFDDERALAALALLGELSRRVQILFFTHHERLLELSRRAVPQDALHVVRLASASHSEASRTASG